MNEIFRVKYLEEKDQIGMLIVENHSSVKSTKYFPMYFMNGKKMLFKPLSKTKPLTTPFFAYSEVFWSNVIHTYFDPTAPIYHLAVSNEEVQPKYFKQGVLVESITPNDEKIFNLYDYFMAHPDSTVNIKDYINYCMDQYDYTKILSSQFILENPEIGKQISFQILLSILRQDQNFHYENISFYEDLSVVPPIDFEFSTPFLYPDNPAAYEKYSKRYLDDLTIPYEDDEMSLIFKRLARESNFPYSSRQFCNLCKITKIYSDVVLDFIQKLENFVQDLPQLKMDDSDSYIGSLNSDYWTVFHALYKDQDIPTYEKLKEEIIPQEIHKEEIFERIQRDILFFSKQFLLTLKMVFLAHENGIEDLENLTVRDILLKLGITASLKIDDIDMATKELKLSKK